MYLLRPATYTSFWLASTSVLSFFLSGLEMKTFSRRFGSSSRLCSCKASFAACCHVVINEDQLFSLGLFTYGGRVLHITESAGAFEFFARPSDIKDFAILVMDIRARLSISAWMLTFPNKSLINLSLAVSGKFVIYSVDFQAKCTEISCSSSRFLSFVNAAGTLS